MPWPPHRRSTHPQPRNPPRPVLLPRATPAAPPPPHSQGKSPPRPESPPAHLNDRLLVARRNRLRGEGRLWRDQRESIKSRNGHKTEINLLTPIPPRIPVEKITNRCFQWGNSGRPRSCAA